MASDSRQLAFEALRLVSSRGAYADAALDRVLSASKVKSSENLRSPSQELDRQLTAELVYGTVRRQRTLDFIIDKFTQTNSSAQRKLPSELRLILRLGVYQLCYLDRIPDSAAVDTTVNLAKSNKFPGLAGLVNAVLRAIARAKDGGDLLAGITDLGILHSYPDWLVQLWVSQFGTLETAQLCMWFNKTPHIDLRVNRLRTSATQVNQALAEAGIVSQTIPNFPDAVRLGQGSGAIARLPGFEQGWWTVQDVSAQLAGYLLDPQPDEVIIDACAAPGGKTTHIAELMQDRGIVWACDRAAHRLNKVKENCQRLGLNCIQTRTGDSREFLDFQNQADRVLLDVPCSGLGTLHRHADARWRQSADEPYKLAILQTELLDQACEWVKPGGTIVYSTCTLHQVENSSVVNSFLARHQNWMLSPPPPSHPAAPFLKPEHSQHWIEIIPHHQDMDGFFMAKLTRLA